MKQVLYYGIPAAAVITTALNTRSNWSFQNECSLPRAVQCMTMFAAHLESMAFGNANSASIADAAAKISLALNSTLQPLEHRSIPTEPLVPSRNLPAQSSVENQQDEEPSVMIDSSAVDALFFKHLDDAAIMEWSNNIDWSSLGLDWTLPCLDYSPFESS